MGYIYDLHVHSSECSGCSKTPVREMVRAYVEQGIYSGFVLTNHFPGRPAEGVVWEDHVRKYWDAYLEAKDEADKLGFQVFFGLEHSYACAQEILLYGIDWEFIESNPDLKELPPEEVTKRVQAYGGFVSHAHPYRKRSYVPDNVIHMDMTLLDGIEIYNAGDREVDDEVAVKRCAELGLIPTAGSDRHNIHEFEKCPFGGVEFDRKIEDNADLVRALKNREGRIWHKGERVFF